MRLARRRVVLAAFFIPVSALSSGPGIAADFVTTAATERGRAVYREHCLECHGEQGRGDGQKARRLGFRPRDFTLGSFKCRCTPSGSLPSDDDLLRVITRGLPGTPMKGFEASLSESERRSVVEYIKSLSPAFAERPAPPCLEIPDPAKTSDESVAAGRQLYRLLKCWSCHGLGGRGDGPAAKTLLDDWGHRIRVYNFTRPGRFKCGAGDRDLYRLLHTGLSGSPMPSYSTALLFSREEADDLTALSGLLGASELAELVAYLGEQPVATALGSLSVAERQSLADQRTWDLIHYLRTLVDP